MSFFGGAVDVVVRGGEDSSEEGEIESVGGGVEGCPAVGDLV